MPGYRAWLPPLVEDTGNSLKFHHFWLKLFTFLTSSAGRCHLAPQDLVGLRFASMGHFGRRERGKRGHPVGAGLGKEEATDELCSLPRLADGWTTSPQHCAGWICSGTRQTQHLLPTSPGGTGSWEGDIKRTSGKAPVWHRRGGSLQ